jgi:hypothetical protein
MEGHSLEANLKVVASFLHRKLTWLSGLAAAALVFTVPWAIESVDMGSTMLAFARSRSESTSAATVWTGTAFIGLAPALGVLSGWLARRCLPKQVITPLAILIALLGGIASLVLGAYLLGLGLHPGR